MITHGGAVPVESCTYYVWSESQRRWNELAAGTAGRLSAAGYVVRLLSKADVRHLRRRGVRLQRICQALHTARLLRRRVWRMHAAAAAAARDERREPANA